MNRLMALLKSLVVCGIALLLSGCIIYPHTKQISPEIEGVVVDSTSKKPVDGVAVTLTQSGYSSKRHASYKTNSVTRTDTSGHFVFPEVRGWVCITLLGSCSQDLPNLEMLWLPKLSFSHPKYAPVEQLDAEKSKGPTSTYQHIIVKDVIMKPLAP